MMRLLAEGLDALDLDSWDSGISCESFDPGSPQTREVVTERPGADGTHDDTRYFGARSVTLGLKIYAGEEYNRRELIDELAKFLHPGRRPILEWEDPVGGGVRKMDLRPSQVSAPLTTPKLTDVAVSFVCPSGIIESAEQRSAWIMPQDDVPGLTFPIEFDFSFPEYVSGPSTVINLGSIPAHWRAAVFGPCTGPILTNANAGQQLSFPGLSIAAGDYLLIDSAERTVLLNDEPTASRYSSLDFSTSTWWQLGVGGSEIFFEAASHAPPASMLMAWRDSFYL